MAILTFKGQSLNQCDRCGYLWKPHKGSRQVACPKCKSRYWISPPPPRKQPNPAIYRLRQRITKEMIIQAIESFNGHYPTLQELGDLPQFNVSRERIRQICKRLAIQRINPARQCRQCGQAIKYAGKARLALGFCARCKPVLRSVEILDLTCGWCGKSFQLTRNLYNSRMRPIAGIRTTPRTTPLFCGKSCYGAWMGTHYGLRHEAARPHRETEAIPETLPLPPGVLPAWAPPSGRYQGGALLQAVPQNTAAAQYSRKKRMKAQV